MEIEKLKHYTVLALTAAFAAGKKILEVYDGAIAVDLKEDGSPLTEADRISNSTILEYLSGEGYPVMSEEEKEIPFEQRKDWKNYWLVDPLDGTKEFIKRNGEFTVNIAFMENNSPVAGIIYQPVKKVAFAGITGIGTYKFKDGDEIILTDDKKISADKNNVDKKFRVIASRTHSSQETNDFINKLSTGENKVELLNAGSSLKFCLIADGSADLYPRFAPTMEWDTAAGHAILKSSGKNIYVYPAGQEMTYNKPKLINDWFIAG